MPCNSNTNLLFRCTSSKSVSNVGTSSAVLSTIVASVVRDVGGQLSFDQYVTKIITASEGFISLLFHVAETGLRSSHHRWKSY